MSGRSDSPDNDRVLMGRIGAAHGIRGEVRIQSFTANPTDIGAYGPLETGRPGLTIEITAARAAKNVVIAKISGIADRNAAEKLNGVELFLPRSRLPAEEDEDDFYHADLIGLEARLEDGTVLGRVLSVPDFGAGDLLEIGENAKTSAYYPFTRAIVPDVNIAEGYLVIVPPAEISVEGGE